jgi:macrolide-specific efflux system membrane fusion protein
MKFGLKILFLAAGLFAAGCGRHSQEAAPQTEEVLRADLRQIVQTTGDIQPKNKVTILPPVSGRIDKILVFEWARVRKGQVLAWMSSSDRAALLDMAAAKGPKEVAYWEQTYKPVPIVAPVDGLLINRYIVEGQTVGGGSTPIYDMSDDLMVRAQVDESDVGNVRVGQQAEVTVDSYPDRPFKAVVELINPSAVMINQVVSFYVQMRMVGAPADLKTGMTANINLILHEKKGVLSLPSFVVKGDENTEVEVRVMEGGKPAARRIRLGESDGNRVQVVEGLREHERVVLASLKLKEASPVGLFGPSGVDAKVKTGAAKGK